MIDAERSPGGLFSGLGRHVEPSYATLNGLQSFWSPREDVGSLTQEFRKSYIDEKFTASKRRQKYAEWDKLMQQLFVTRK
jgi:hypothetical protein